MKGEEIRLKLWVRTNIVLAPCVVDPQGHAWNKGEVWNQQEDEGQEIEDESTHNLKLIFAFFFSSLDIPSCQQVPDMC